MLPTQYGLWSSELGKPNEPEEPDDDVWVIIKSDDVVGFPEVSALSPPEPEIDLGELWWDEGYDYPEPLQPEINLEGYEWDTEYEYRKAV